MVERKAKTGFNESDYKLFVSMYDTLERPLDIMGYLLEKGHLSSYVIVLFYAIDATDFKEHIVSQKRDSDLLLETRHEGVCFVICQETEVDGGYRFARRIIDTYEHDLKEKVKAVELEVKTLRYKTKEILLRLFEFYLATLKDEKSERIFYHSLH